jgi:Ser-tRNA(Ala) deacylase AlaX
VDSQIIGRFIDVTAMPDTVTAICDGHHQRSWAKQAVVTDPVDAATAARMRQSLALDRQRRQAATRQHSDGHAVALRARPDYAALSGVDFDPAKIFFGESSATNDSTPWTTTPATSLPRTNGRR